MSGLQEDDEKKGLKVFCAAGRWRSKSEFPTYEENALLKHRRAAFLTEKPRRLL